MRFLHTQGYMTLLSVLTVSAVGIAITVTLLILGTSASQVGLIAEQEVQARQLAHGCIELALEHVKESSGYTGTTNVDPFGAGSCAYTVTNTGGNTRGIQAHGDVGRVIQRVEVTLSNVSPVIIASWQEVAEF